MKKWITRIALLGLAVLPSSVQAQYPVPGYYGQPMPGYGNPYAYPTVGNYYYSQPAPTYVPYGYYQGNPVYYYRPAQAMASTPVAANSTPVASIPAVRANEAPVANAPISGPVNAQFTAPPVPVPARNSPSAAARASEEAPEPVGAPGVTKGGTPPGGAEAGGTPPAATPPATTPPAAGSTSLWDSLTNCTDKRARFSVFAEFLYWNVHGGDVPYAQAFDGVDPRNSVPRGPVGVASPRFTPGIRGGVGVSLNEDSWIVGTFTYLRVGTFSGLAATGGNVLRNFLVFPNTVNAAVDSLTAKTDYHIELVTADADYKHAIVNNDCLLLNWLAGARFGHLSQDLLNQFQILGSTTVDSHIHLDAGGPRAGLEGEYRVAGGLYGYGHGIVNLLFGRFQGGIEERNVFGGLIGHTTVDENRVVPILEFELGAGWKSSDGRIRVSAGYYVGCWFNVMTLPSLSQGIQNVNFTTNGNNFRDSLIFDGFVSRFEYRF